MYGYLAAISPDAVRFLGREPDFDTFMSLLTGDDGLELGQMWDAVDRVVSTLLGGRVSITSGTPVTSDLGFGPARFLSRDDVRSMAAALGGVSDARVAAAYASTGMHDGYPAAWREPDAVTTLEPCTMTSVRSALALVERAAARNLGLVFVVV